tara:strand:+ start:2278 stop:3261 length:984 start_codon:yes stop_codon:yes gene_type:complete
MNSKILTMNKSFFKVLRAGINTTYQDEGRFGLQHLGIAAGGCMDYKNFFLGNSLVKNKSQEGVIEFAYQGPLLRLMKGNTKIAITGNVYFQIIYSKNDKKIDGECYRSYDLMEGDQIDIIATQKSVYGYLSVENGFDVKPFFNSISTLSRAQIGPNEGKKLNTDNEIFIKENSKIKNNFISKVSFKTKNIIRVLKGFQYDYFSEKSKKDFFSKSYNITNLTDRMGMRLEGETINNIVNTNIKSEGITKGAIQIPADGQPIILLTDHPTIGGYPKIANVISADYDVLIQKTPGENIEFKLIELNEAEELYKEYLAEIKEIIKDIKEIN